jgi:hypothetical protein
MGMITVIGHGLRSTHKKMGELEECEMPLNGTAEA